MGIFGGKTIITVSSVAYNIAGDANTRQSFMKQSLIYLNAANLSIGEKLPRMYLKSLGMKLKRAYKYAASSAQGLPTASMQLWEYQEFDDAVQALLNIEFGANHYKVVDTYLTESSTAPAIEKYLNSKYGWDSVTGLMATPPTGFSSNTVVTWYQQSLSDIRSRGYVIEFRHLAATVEPDLVVNISLDAINDSNQSILVAMISEWLQTTRSDITTTRPFVIGDVAGTVTTPYITTSGSRITNTTTTVITITNGVETTVRTRIVDATTSEAVSKRYQLGINEYPTLDAIWINSNHIEQTYFPSIPFRIDSKDVLDEKLENTAAFKATKKVVSLMGMDALSIRDQLNVNKDVKDIDYAFLQAGVNMNTQSQAEMDYLFRFWELCEGRQTATQATLTAWEALAAAVRPKPSTNRLEIQDTQSGNGAYKIAIEWDWVKKTLVDGQISPTAKVGTLDIVAGSGLTYEFTTSNSRLMMDSTVISIRKQINPLQYEVIQISGAIHKNDVYKGKTIETLAKDSRAEPDKNEGFIIPLHMGIFDTMPLTKRTQLAQECIYMVFNCYVKTKQKWYQTSAFKWILAIVLVVITVLSLGTATPAATAVWGAVTLATTFGISSALASLIMSYVIGYLVSYLMGKWAAGFESVFGKKWGQVVMAIVTIATTVVTGGGFGSSASWLKTAVQIIDVANQLFAAYVKGATMVMKGEYDAFMNKAEEDKKTLKKLSSEFFGDNDLVSIDYLLQLQKTLREDSPTVFLTRTLITGTDVVDITLGQISEMVTMNTAPRLQGIFI